MAKDYPLQDIPEPNLVEDQFPYSLPPLIKFTGTWTEEIDGHKVTFDPAARIQQDIHITDTTFRDGQQARPPYTPEQMVTLYEMMSRLSGPHGVVRQTEFFLYTKHDREALDRCRELGLRYPEITGWIRAVKGDFRLVKEAGLQESGMLTSISDYHIFYKQKQTRPQAFDQYIEVVEAALEHGVRPRCHLEDVTRADLKGMVIPFIQKLVRLGEQVQPHLTPKVRLCDTMGFGLSYPNVAAPRSIAKLCWYMTHECGLPPERLEWHGHNDFHKVHINGATAWFCGCNALNCSMFGYGERCGNPPLEGAIMEYIALKGSLCGIDTKMITEMARYMQGIGLPIPDNYPLAGKHFNTTRAGIHAGGLRRDERIYNIFDTEALLDRPPRVAITDKTGTDGIAWWVNDFLGTRNGEDEVKLTQVVKIQKWVMEQYNQHGRLTPIGDEELEEQVRVHLPDLYAKYRLRR